MKFWTASFFTRSWSSPLKETKWPYVIKKHFTIKINLFALFFLYWKNKTSFPLIELKCWCLTRRKSMKWLTMVPLAILQDAPQFLSILLCWPTNKACIVPQCTPTCIKKNQKPARSIIKLHGRSFIFKS